VSTAGLAGAEATAAAVSALVGSVEVTQALARSKEEVDKKRALTGSP
jgi:hypothetical protein